jgi:hypothetical protein
MGAVCAVVYLLAIIVFIPFPFYKDIVAATSGAGSRKEVYEVTDVNVGRHLQRFPHNKVCLCSDPIPQDPVLIHLLARYIPISNTVTTIRSHPRSRRRPLRHSLATQSPYTSFCLYTHACCLLRRLWRYECRSSNTTATIFRRHSEPRLVQHSSLT